MAETTPEDAVRDYLTSLTDPDSLLNTQEVDRLQEEVLIRLVPGVIGLLILGGLRLASRRWPDGRFRLLTNPVAGVGAGLALVVATSFMVGPHDSPGIQLAGILTCVAVGGACLGDLARGRVRGWPLVGRYHPSNGVRRMDW